MKFSVDFLGIDGPSHGKDLSELITATTAAKDWMTAWPIDDAVTLLDCFSNRLMDRNCRIAQKYAHAGVNYIAHWCRRAQIEKLLSQSFYDRRVLDSFIPIRDRQDRRFRAFPRGLVVHWTAGNIPTIGFLSLVQGILTKNSNIVKLASNSDGLVADLVRELCKVGRDMGVGERLAESLAIVRFGRAQAEEARLLSEAADVRMIWGTDKAVEEIRAFPSKIGVQDLVFRGKESLAIITEEALEINTEGLARRLAIDVSVFEQKACASPHTVFIKAKSDIVVERFAEALHAALRRTLDTYPKKLPSSVERTTVLNLRAEYDMFHRAWYSDGIEYSIFADDQLKIGPMVGNRTVFLRRVEDLATIAGLITDRIQTVGLAVGKEDVDALAAMLSKKGVQRFARIGTMTEFDIPWDGCLIPQTLVRWSSCPLSQKAFV